MDEEYLINLIYEYNPQLTGKKIEVPEYRRKLYWELKKWMEKKQILAITGLRRMGKTTLMRQLMQELEGSMFFSFDEEDMQKKEVLTYVIDYFVKELSAKYIFLDEIHYVPDWEGVLKRYYDTKSLKFIISGSESLEISKAKESLVGRMIVFHLGPLSFSEFLGMKGIFASLSGEKIKDFDGLKREYHRLLPKKDDIEELFKDYVFKGAFPEIVDEEDEDIIQKYIRELVVKKIIYRDIPSIFQIKMRGILYDIFLYVCENSSGIFNIRSLAENMKISYETAESYLFYLKSSFLIKISQNYSRSPAKRMRKNKKVHVVHPSLALAVLSYSRRELRDRVMGQYVESLFAGDYFWRDKNKNEVDLIIEEKNPIPVEIKYQNMINKEDLRGILRFMEKFESPYGVVITKNIFKSEEIKGNRVYFVPAWLWAIYGNLSGKTIYM